MLQWPSAKAPSTPNLRRCGLSCSFILRVARNRNARQSHRWQVHLLLDLGHHLGEKTQPRQQAVAVHLRGRAEAPEVGLRLGHPVKGTSSLEKGRRETQMQGEGGKDSLLRSGMTLLVVRYGGGRYPNGSRQVNLPETSEEPGEGQPLTVEEGGSKSLSRSDHGRSLSLFSSPFSRIATSGSGIGTASAWPPSSTVRSTSAGRFTS